MELLDNMLWWKAHEDRVYQVIHGVFASQETFARSNVDIVNRAVGIVLEVERRKAEGRFFVAGTPHLERTNRGE